MATHSSILAWRIPGTEEPRRLPSMGSHRVGHDWSNLAAATVWILRKENGQSHVFTWWRLRRDEEMIKLKYLQTINPKGNQPWIFIGRTDAKAEAPIFWPPDAKNWFIGKDSDAGKDWGRKWRGWWWMSWLDGITVLMHMSLSKLLDWWWQRILACCRPWCIKESDMAEWAELIWNK